MEHCRFTFTPTEISAYYGARMPDLRQRGARWRGACGIHKGTRGSFSVHPETGLWRCWSDCNRGGDIITLEVALTGGAWLDAVEEIERIVGRPLLNRSTNRIERRALADRLARDQREGQNALFWRIAAESMAEELLAELPEAVPERFGPTQFLLSLRAANGRGLLTLYRDYCSHDSQLAAALEFAGERAWRRRCDALAGFVAAGAEVNNAA